MLVRFHRFGFSVGVTVSQQTSHASGSSTVTPVRGCSYDGDVSTGTVLHNSAFCSVGVFCNGLYVLQSEVFFDEEGGLH